MSKNRRRQMVVDRKFQFQPLMICMALTLAIIAFIAFFTYVFATAAGKDWGEIFNTRLLIGFAIFLLLNALVVGLIGVSLSHRVAGASYRLNRCVDAMRGGDLEMPITLRKKDYLKDLARNLTQLRDSMKEDRGTARNVLGKLEQVRSSINGGEHAEALSAACESLRKMAGEDRAS